MRLHAALSLFQRRVTHVVWTGLAGCPPPGLCHLLGLKILGVVVTSPPVTRWQGTQAEDSFLDGQTGKRLLKLSIRFLNIKRKKDSTHSGVSDPL